MKMVKELVFLSVLAVAMQAQAGYPTVDVAKTLVFAGNTITVYDKVASYATETLTTYLQEFGKSGVSKAGEMGSFVKDATGFFSNLSDDMLDRLDQTFKESDVGGGCNGDGDDEEGDDSNSESRESKSIATNTLDADTVAQMSASENIEKSLLKTTSNVADGYAAKGSAILGGSTGGSARTGGGSAGEDYAQKGESLLSGITDVPAGLKTQTDKMKEQVENLKSQTLSEITGLSDDFVNDAYSSYQNMFSAQNLENSFGDLFGSSEKKSSSGDSNTFKYVKKASEYRTKNGAAADTANSEGTEKSGKKDIAEARKQVRETYFLKEKNPTVQQEREMETKRADAYSKVVATSVAMSEGVRDSAVDDSTSCSSMPISGNSTLEDIQANTDIMAKIANQLAAEISIQIQILELEATGALQGLDTQSLDEPKLEMKV